ncbi:MAG: C4-type zinc ribbon domain-containing protein [Anaerolineales bacterium]
MSQTLNLYRLQQIDSQMDRPANARCLSAEQALKQAERDVQSQIIKIEQTQSSLYGEKSHSPKELQDLQNDVFALKRHLVTLEDRQIDAMQESETSEAEQQFAHAKVSAALDSRVELNKGLHHEQEMIKNELERFLLERNAVSGAIPTAELGLYVQLRQQRRGVAVAVIAENSCGACGTTLSLAQVQSAHASDHIMLCPSCGRILYAS